MRATPISRPCFVGAGVWLVAFLLPVLAWAVPGLRPPAQVGPVAGLLYQAPERGSLSVPGQPLLNAPTPAGLMGIYAPFAQKQVRVDSAGIHYTPSVAGQPSGPELTLALEDYLKLGYRHELAQLWDDQVRRNRRTLAEKQQREGGGRLQWTVPFPRTPRAVRRIIGEEGPSLRINGERTITVAGKSEWTDGEVQTLSGRASKFPALSMEQESKFSVEGKVGELINIRITQDTENLGSAFGSNLSDQLANQIKLDYKGDEDAIFQEVQAGNTTLSLPTNRFVAFNQQHKGLFGIRAKGRMGPLSFTSIASHEKSKSNRKSFKGGVLGDTLTLKDFQYLPNTYFYLDQVYRQRLGDFREASQGTPRDYVPEDAVNENSLEVYLNDFNINNDPEQKARPGVAWVDLAGPVDERSGYVERGTWNLLDPDKDYTLVPQLGYIILNRSVDDRFALAVRYRTVGSEVAPGRQFGTVDGDTLRLKLIKARDPRPDFPTWNLEWKNVYKISNAYSEGRKFDRDKIEIQILEEVAGREPQSSQGGRSLLQIMGLDERGKDPGSPPDRVVDSDYFGLDEFRGVLIVPDQTPFDPQHSRYKGLQNTVPAIYNSQQSRERNEASRYQIKVLSRSGEQRINLGQLGIDPESVEVRLNGERLTQGTDYNVGFSGEITFLGNKAEAVGDPGADLEINYESEDLAGLGSQQKTLLGLRSEYEFWDGDGTIGSTLIYNNERSGERRVRVGNEPARTLVWDMDLKARVDAPFLTRAVDLVPLLRTVEKSEVNLQAEVAQSRPNLNTKGQGYIDDFEGSERPELMPVIRTRWNPASRPIEGGFEAEERGRLIWYNPYDRVPRVEIWPGQEDQVDAQNDETDVLTLELKPAQTGTHSWGGVMTAFTGGARDFSLSKFLDVWVRGEQGLLAIDLGSITEDQVADGRLNTEDIPLPGQTAGDGVVAAEEDQGLDGRFDDQELRYYLGLAGADTTGSVEQMRAQFAGIYPDRNPEDPEGDNWEYKEKGGDYSRVNGTQGNRYDSENRDRPDSEDLNNDGVLNTRNDYYHYTIDLAHDEAVPGTLSNGWRLFRVPLFGEGVEKVGRPDSSRIEAARLVVVDEANRGLKTEVAQMEVIGNEWQVVGIQPLEGGAPVREEEGFDVQVIGSDVNRDYKPPPGVKIRRNLQSRTREREQSLVLDYDNLEPLHQATATRVLSLTRPANYTKYTRLKMYVHGDEAQNQYADADSSQLELFLRFGIDSTNYYEYATRVFPGWDRRNEVEIDLVEMAQLKLKVPAEGLRRDQVLDTLITDPAVRDGAPARYRMRGSPSMQQVKSLSLGLRHLGHRQAFSGRVFTDEMRLDGARNDAGLAVYTRVNAKLADFMNVDGNVEWQGEDFRTLNATDRANSDFNTSVQTTANMNQFLPGSWGFSIPVKVSLSRNESLPRYGPNADVELNADQKQEQRSQTTKRQYEVQVSKRASQRWWWRWTVDQVNLRLSATRENGFDPVRPLRHMAAHTASFSYQLPLPKPSLPVLAWLPEFMPAGVRQLRFAPLPSIMSYSANLNQQRQTTLQRTDADTTFQEDFDLRETYSSKISPFGFINGDYSLQIERDLRKKLAPGKLSFGTEVERVQKADVDFNPRLIQWLDQNYSFQANYEETNDPRRRRVQAVIDTVTGLPVKTRDINTKTNLSARFNLRVPAILQGLGAPGAKGAKRAKVEKPGKDKKKEVDAAEMPKAPKPAAPAAAAGNPFILRRMLYASGDYVEPFNLTWRGGADIRSFNVVDRPSLRYQLGLEDSLKVRTAGVGLTQQDQESHNTSLEAGTGMKLPLGLSVKADFRRQLNRRSGSTQNRLRVEQQQDYPKLSVTWGRADRIPYVRKVISSAQVNVSYQRSQNSEGETNLHLGNLLRREKSTEVRASWSGRWKIGPSTKIEVTRSQGLDYDYESDVRADSAGTGGLRPLRGSGSLEKGGTTFEVRHTLKPRGLPLFGKLKSNIELKFEVGVDGERKGSATGDAARVTISQSSRVKLNTSATYKFSESFSGRALIRLENNRNDLTDKTRKVREVSLSGTLYFR
ncbi:MAG: cell surface protein SprA [Candidatus Latescibacteria bacterium]|nr:cell surface protein SprA [Candidatus Latescibacterota bacterium]